MPTTKPPTTNAVNMKDVYTSTSTSGDVVVTLDNVGTVKPTLTYARGQLTGAISVMSDTGGSVTYPAGTTLKTVSITPDLAKCTVKLVGPKNEPLSNAPVLVFFSSFENAK